MELHFVLVTHEGSVGFMADVYGRLTGKPGACLSRRSSGATKLATGVGNAFLDRVPLVPALTLARDAINESHKTVEGLQNAFGFGRGQFFF